jgi:hypothetical protein
MKEDVRYYALIASLLHAGLYRRAPSLALMRFSPTDREERFTC